MIYPFAHGGDEYTAYFKTSVYETMESSINQWEFVVPPTAWVAPDICHSTELHVLVGFSDFETSGLAATTSVIMNLTSNALPAGQSTVSNVFCGREATGYSTYAHALAMK